MGKREEQKIRRRKEIMEVALNLFVTKGYTATKISDIAKEANMSIGLLFHYFDSKEKLYEEFVRIGLQGTKYPGSMQCNSAIEYFEIFTKQLFDAVKLDSSIAKIFSLMAEAQKNEGIPVHILQIAREVQTIHEFIPMIENGQKEGTIRDGEPLVLSNAFWCSIQGIMEHYAAHPEMGLPESEWIVDIIRGGK